MLPSTSVRVTAMLSKTSFWPLLAGPCAVVLSLTRIAVADRAGGEVDRGDGQLAVGCRDRQGGQRHHAVHHHRRAADGQVVEAVRRRDVEDAALRQVAGIRAGAVAKVVLVDHLVAAGGIDAGDGDAVIGAVDGDRQRRRRGVAVGVGQRVAEHFRQRLARRQALHRGKAVVELVGVVAGSVDGQRAVGAGNRVADRACPGDRAKTVRTPGVGRAVAGVGVRPKTAVDAAHHIARRNRRTIFRHRIDIVDRGRYVVDDAHDEAGGGVAAVDVGQGDRDVVEDIVLAVVARPVRGRVVAERIAVADRAGGEVDRGDGQLAVGCRDRQGGQRHHAVHHHRRAADGQVVEAVRRRDVEDAALRQVAGIRAGAVAKVVLVDQPRRRRWH